jgi:uncharacterized protein (DUF433 family)
MADQTVIAAYSEDQAARLTDISVGQLRYWDRTDFFHPEFAYEERRAAFSRIYSYLDLVSLKVIARLRNETSLQQLRQVKEKLAEIGPDLWRGVELWVQNKKVAYVRPETGEPEEVVSGQRLLKLPLREITDDLDEELRTITARDKGTVGTIDRSRRVMRNRRVVAGTRIPIDAIRSFHEAGYGIADIIAEYPSLTPLDVEAALADDHAA